MHRRRLNVTTALLSRTEAGGLTEPRRIKYQRDGNNQQSLAENITASFAIARAIHPESPCRPRHNADFDNPHGVICNFPPRHRREAVKPAGRTLRRTHSFLCNQWTFACLVTALPLDKVAFAIFGVAETVNFPVVRILGGPIPEILGITGASFWVAGAVLGLFASTPLTLANGLGAISLVSYLRPRHKWLSTRGTGVIWHCSRFRLRANEAGLT